VGEAVDAVVAAEAVAAAAVAGDGAGRRM
jgi:hypothetical protein